MNIKVKEEEKKHKSSNSVGLVILIIAIEIIWHVVFGMSLILLGVGIVILTALTVHITSKLLGSDKIEKQKEQTHEQNWEEFEYSLREKQPNKSNENSNEKTENDSSIKSSEIYISCGYSFLHNGQELKKTICVSFDDGELIPLNNLRSGAKVSSCQEIDLAINNNKQEELSFKIFQKDEDPMNAYFEDIAEKMEPEQREKFLLNMKKAKNISNKVVFLGKLRIIGTKKIKKEIPNIIVKICYEYSCLKPIVFYKSEEESNIPILFSPSEEYLFEARRVYDIFQKLYNWGDEFAKP